MLKISVYLPDKVVHNDDLAKLFSDWDSGRIFEQTGIKRRHYATQEENTSDLGFRALEKLLRERGINKNSIDFLICVTSTPDQMQPATAFKIHAMADMPKTCGAYDISQGCAGFTYELFTAKSMIISGMASNVILITADILARYCLDDDRSTKILMGDGASACLIDRNVAENMGEFICGADGSGYDYITVKNRDALSGSPAFYMNGMDVFYFAISEVPKMITEILAKNNTVLSDIDMIVLHQANKAILEYIKKHLKVSDNKFFINMEETGNTSASTIPIALDILRNEGRLRGGMNVLILGFGSGLSWCGTIIKWQENL